jgi:hypothetical protein
MVETLKVEVKRVWKVETVWLAGGGYTPPLIVETVKDDVPRVWKVEIVWLAGGGYTAPLMLLKYILDTFIWLALTVSWPGPPLVVAIICGPFVLSATNAH